jgi:osmotically inducible protein OsmC
MAVIERKASVVWEGNMRVGSGTVDSASGAFSGLPISFGDRLEPETPSTSPEEFIASAHAASYVMALSNTLGSNGSQPQRLEVTAACDLDRTPDGLAITRSRLEVKGIVPRLDEASFVSMAEKAETKCLVSNAIRGNVEIELTARLLPDDQSSR